MTFFSGSPPYPSPSYDPSTYINKGYVLPTAEKQSNGFFGKLLGGAFPIVGSLLTSGIQYLFDSLAAKKQREYAQDAWNQQAIYNSPAAMLARYKAVGMHPAYGSEHFNSDAPTFTSGISAVASPQIPDINSVLNQYQELKSRNAQERNLLADLENQKMLNEILEKTRDAKVDKELLQPRLADMLYQKQFIETMNNKILGKLKANSLIEDVNLKKQQFGFRKEINPFETAIKKIQSENMGFGLTDHDSTFLRVLSRMKLGNDFSKSLLPYVIGDRFASFAGDLLKIAVPTGYIGKLWQATKGLKGSPSSSMPRQSY